MSPPQLPVLRLDISSSTSSINTNTNLSADPSTTVNPNIHTCRWDWCREVFDNHVELVEHVLSAHASTKPVKRKELGVELRAQGRNVDFDSSTSTGGLRERIEEGQSIVDNTDAPSFNVQGPSSSSPPHTPRRTPSQPPRSPPTQASPLRARTRTPSVRARTQSRPGTPSVQEAPSRSPTPTPSTSTATVTPTPQMQDRSQTQTQAQALALDRTQSRGQDAGDIVPGPKTPQRVPRVVLELGMGMGGLSPSKADQTTEVTTSVSASATASSSANPNRRPGQAHIHSHSQHRFHMLTEQSSPAYTPESVHATDGLTRSPSTAEMIANLINQAAAEYSVSQAQNEQARLQRERHEKSLHHHRYDVLQYHPPVAGVGGSGSSSSSSASASGGVSTAIGEGRGLDPALTIMTPEQRREERERRQEGNSEKGKGKEKAQSNEESERDGVQDAGVQVQNRVGESSNGLGSPNAGRASGDHNGTDASPGSSNKTREFKHGSLALRIPGKGEQQFHTHVYSHSHVHGHLRTEGKSKPIDSNPITTPTTTSPPREPRTPQRQQPTGLTIPSESLHVPDDEMDLDSLVHHHPQLHSPELRIPTPTPSQEYTQLPSQLGPASDGSQWHVPIMTQVPYEYDYSLSMSDTARYYP